MALTLKPVRREFIFNGRKLGDPDPRMTPDAVRNCFGGTYPEIAASTIEKEMHGEVECYTFRTAIGTKG